MINPFSKIRLFYTETIGELKKAAWPTYAELRHATVVVIIAAILLGCFVGLVDFSLFQIVSLLTEWVHPLQSF